MHTCPLKKKSGFFIEARKRLSGYLIAVFVLWPLMSAMAATVSALSLPYFKVLLARALLVCAGGIAVMLPDMVIVGSLYLLICITIFSFLASLKLTNQKNSQISYMAEPIMLFFTVLFGSSLYYPAILSHPIFIIFGALPAWVLISILASITIGWGVTLALPGHRISVVSILLISAILAPLPSLCGNHRFTVPLSPPPLILLGIDSLSHSDDLSYIRQFTQSNGGAWYKHAVSPGLLTNAVWTSILVMKPVREHGVFHTFQSRPKCSTASLVEEANKQGYYTVSVFPDQLTCWVGSDYAFNLDLSGPIGWRQLTSQIFGDASVLLPLVKPILPKFPFSSVPPNHTGSFTYSIDREFNEIFSQSSVQRGTLVIGHSTYLHVPAYPKYLDLSFEDFKRVLLSRASRLKDRSFDWQDLDQPDDAIPIRRWKVMHVQTAIADAMKRFRFFERGGKMILFSDHGDRVGLSDENFHDERYHHVMFATFGLPVRDLSLPISLIDSASILGLVQHKPFNPVVEYTNGNASEWSLLMKSASLKTDGSVHLNVGILSNIFKRLRSHQPWVTMPKNKMSPKSP